MLPKEEVIRRLKGLHSDHDALIFGCGTSGYSEINSSIQEIVSESDDGFSYSYWSQVFEFGDFDYNRMSGIHQSDMVTVQVKTDA